jgi:hypothetical protein
MEEKVKNKGGRPLLNQPKSCTITGAFTELEFGLIKAKADALRITRSEYVSMMATKGKVVDTFSPEQRKAVTDLIGIKNNLNQLAKLAHVGGIGSMANQLDDLIKYVRTIIEKGR